jgi:hypothetical protein
MKYLHSIATCLNVAINFLLRLVGHQWWYNFSCPLIFYLGAYGGFRKRVVQLSIIDERIFNLSPKVSHLPFLLEGGVLAMLVFFVLDRFATFLGATSPLHRRSWLLSGFLTAIMLSSLPSSWGVVLPVFSVLAAWGGSLVSCATFRSHIIRYRTDVMALLCVAIANSLLIWPLADPLLLPYKIESLKFVLPMLNAITSRTIVPAIAAMQEPAWSPAIFMGGAPMMDGAFGSSNYLEIFLNNIMYISSVDVYGLLFVAKFSLFLVFVLGSLGCYLLLRWGARVSRPISLALSLVFLATNGIIWRHPEITWATGIVLMPSLTFFILLCFRRGVLLDFALCGAASGIFMQLVFQHPEQTLDYLYFSGIMISVYSISESRALRRRLCDAINRSILFVVFGIISNYRFVGGLWDYLAMGNTIKSFRFDIAYMGGGLYDGPWVVIKDVLGPFGLLGAAPLPPYGIGSPLYYGLPIGFLILIGLFSVPIDPAVRLLKRFSIIALLLFPFTGMSEFLPVQILYLLGAPGVPGHTGLRLSGMILPSILVLAGLGGDTLLLALRSKLRLARVKKIYFRYCMTALIMTLFFSALAMYADKLPMIKPHPFAAGLIVPPALFKAVMSTILQALLMWGVVIASLRIAGCERAKTVALCAVVATGALLSINDSTMIMGVKYQNTLLSELKQKGIGENNLPTRLSRQQLFVDPSFPVSLTTILSGAVFDLTNPRTQNFLRTKVIPGIDKAVASSQEPEKKWLNLRNQMIESNMITKEQLVAMIALSPVFDSYYRVGKEDGLAVVSWLMDCIGIKEAPFRIALTAKAKEKAGDAIHNWPHLETSHYFVSGAGNARWYSILDYYSGEIFKIMASSTYYDGNMLPLDVETLQALNFSFALITQEEEQDWPGLKIVARRDGLSLLEFPNPAPRAFYAAAMPSTFPPPTVKTANSAKRINDGREALRAVDLRTTVLVEPHNNMGLPSTVPERSSVTVKAIIGNFAAFETDASQAGLLIYSDMFHPDWRAYVDGVQVDVLKANLAFKAITVPGGKHLVWFEFFSWRLYIAKIVALAAGIMLLLPWRRFLPFRNSSEVSN